MTIKKYFSISEICYICQLPLHKLRYIEQTDKNFLVMKIRNRRYYTINNIHYLLSTYSKNKIDIEEKLQQLARKISVNNTNNNIYLLKRINNLINKFTKLLDYQSQ